MIGKGASLLAALVDRAFETGDGLRSRLGSLVACVLVVFAVLVVARLFMAVGVWALVAIGWSAIAGFVWRFRGNIDLSRLRDAVRDDGAAPRAPVPDVAPGTDP